MADVYNLVVRAEIDNETKDYYFDYVEDNTVTLTSDITTHPLVNGDIIADHMYNNPSTVSFNGTFSLNGNKKYNFGTNDRLANIQETFEKIQHDGIMCTLIKMNENGDNARFKVRKNMVLTSITWTEKQTSIDFSFSFNEALTASVQEPEYDKDITDTSLPLLSNPIVSDVTDELINKEDLIQATIALLSKNYLIEQTFLEHAINSAIRTSENLQDYAKSALAGAAVGATVGGVASISSILVMSAIFSTIPGPGWIASAIILGVGVVVGVFSGILKVIKNNKYKTKPFKYYKNKKKQQKEEKRFYAFLDKILAQFDSLESSIDTYGFGEDTPQECMLTIDSNYYVFSFTKSTEDSQYALQVKSYQDLNNKELITDISEKAISTLSECNNSTLLFTTSSNVQVYLANKEISAQRESGATNDEIQEYQKKLTSYSIIVSRIDLTKFKDIMNDIITSQIIK